MNQCRQHNNHYTIFMDLLISMERVGHIPDSLLADAVADLSVDERKELKARLEKVLNKLEKPAIQRLWQPVRFCLN